MRNSHITKSLQEKFGDPIGSYAGDAPVGVRSVDEHETHCASCGMPAVDGSCECHDDMVCHQCGMMPVDGLCGCEGLHEAVEPCEACGMLEVDGSCGCTHMQEKESVEENASTSKKCECKCADCVKYSHDSDKCKCGSKDLQKTEVAPKGYEKIVKALKKEPSIENPWAVAWSLKKKGIRPKR